MVDKNELIIRNDSYDSGNSFNENDDYNDDQYILLDMGFDKAYIKKIYSFLKPNNIENAIFMMTKDNGLYNHNFFSRKSGDSNLCYLCGEEKKFHQNFNHKEDNFNEKNYDSELDVIERKSSIDEELFLCNICGDEYPKNQMEKNDKCPSYYCKNCWYSYLKEKIENNIVGNIKCMDNCKNILSTDFILKFISNDKKLLDKFNIFKNKLEILNDPNKVFCPHPNCESYGIKKKDTHFIQCQIGHKFCSECMGDWHEGNSCEKKLEDEFKIWAKNKIVKKCPKCQMWTEKNEGCNHMTCAECKYQWCWLCGKKYYEGHYTQGECNGLQFFKPKSEEEILQRLNENKQIMNEVRELQIAQGRNFNLSPEEGQYFIKPWGMPYDDEIEINYFLIPIYLLIYFFGDICLFGCGVMLTVYFYNDGLLIECIYWGTILMMLPIFIAYSSLVFCIKFLFSLPCLFYPPLIKKYAKWWMANMFSRTGNPCLEDFICIEL